MRLRHLAAIALLVFVSGCICADTVQDTRFACEVTSDCLAGNVCRGSECRPDDVPPGSCLPGERQSCTVASCERPCGADGGWASCEPATGPGFATNPLNCGDCGRRCADRLGDALTCIDGRCTCVTDLDCPSGDVCLTGGVCALSTDLCARISCATGSVCRAGVCAPVACADGCGRGEVCDQSSGNCRPILPCRFAVPCGDGGICEGQQQPDGESCNDGNDCTSGDSCRAGSCSGTVYSCPAAGQCQQSLACAGDGGCTVTPEADGTPCDDTQLCTSSDQCVSGVCTGAAYTCMPNQCAATSACAGDGGCDVTPRNIGSSCDDGVSCTFSDLCTPAGACAGTTYSCPGLTTCKQAGTCLGDGGCDVVNKPDTTPCDDGLACSSGETCTSGVCSGGSTTTTYLDSDGDGRGDVTMTLNMCPAPSNYVADGGDCNDTSPFVQNTMPAVRDADQDGVTANTTLDVTACVGATTMVSGRTYYRSSSGAYNWLDTPSATADCNEAEADVFDSRPAMVTDSDRDGFGTGAVTTQCVGTSSVINGRTYYANAAGAFVYLDQSASLGGDCNDGDADVFTNRSVALDVDHDGFTTSTTTGTQCMGAPTVINTRTYYDDAAGNPNWLGSASAVSDCNDASAAVTGPTLFYADGDADTFGAGTGTARCAALTGEVSNNTDCDGANGFIHTNRSVATDADNDSFTTTTATATRCTGSSALVNTRTYYRDAANALSQLGAASSTVDCNDTDASTFPQTYYPDTDGDTRGAATGGQVQCPRQANFVANNTDCNDGAVLVYQTVSGLYDDADQDGYSNAAAASLCVGATTVVNTRTYYRTTTGAYPYTTTQLGADCNTGNATLFTSRNNVVADDDRDGYPSSVVDGTQCGGATTTVGTRTYFADGTGGFWMGRVDCLQKQGSSCHAGFVDCYDLNASATFGQPLYFTAHRGDGSFDYDCSGSATANTTVTFCASTVAGVALFADDMCVTPNGSGTKCVTPTVFAAPAACGKFTAGTATFTNPAICQPDTLATATVIGCR